MEPERPKPSIESYTMVVQPDDNGTFVAYLPAIAGCHAIGRTPAEAQAELALVFQMVVEEYAEKGRSLPRDVPVNGTWQLGPATSSELPENSVL